MKMGLYMSTKAQIISSDFIVALSVFLIIIAIIYSLWITKSYSIEEERRIASLGDSAILASNILMREGNPKYWNQTNVIDLGLQNNNRLNQTKIEMLNDIGYKKVKSMLGLQNYEFFMNIYDSSNRTIFDFGYMGEAKNIAKVKRAGILNESIVFIDIMVWSR